MKSIEDLYFEKTTTRKEKDADGNIIEVPQTKKTKRDPNVVSQGVRFGYFVIDVIVIYALAFLLGIVIAIVSPELLYSPVLDLFGYLLFYFYYTLMEGLAGATVGKLILGYTVIDVHAEKPSFGTIMLRTICRFVPFEGLSCLGERGWHDQWSKTYVVHIK